MSQEYGWIECAKKNISQPKYHLCTLSCNYNYAKSVNMFMPLFDVHKMLAMKLALLPHTYSKPAGI